MPLARAAAALLATLLLAGCGAGEPTVHAGGGAIAITLDDFLIAPQDVVVPRGPVTLRIADRGRLRHSFRLWGADSEPVAVRTIFPGEEKVRTADLAPGEYRMVCTVSNHAELGMSGRLVVR
jgi:plastocyanin